MRRADLNKSHNSVDRDPHYNDLFDMQDGYIPFYRSGDHFQQNDDRFNRQSSEYNNIPPYSADGYDRHFADNTNNYSDLPFYQTNERTGNKSDKMDHSIAWGAVEQRLPYGLSNIKSFVSNDKMNDIPYDLLNELPYNGSGTQWNSNANPNTKWFKIILAVGSVLVYSMASFGFGLYFVQKVSHKFRGAQGGNLAIGILFAVVGLMIFYFYSMSKFQRMKECTVELEGMIVSYKKRYSS